MTCTSEHVLSIRLCVKFWTWFCVFFCCLKLVLPDKSVGLGCWYYGPWAFTLGMLYAIFWFNL